MPMILSTSLSSTRVSKSSTPPPRWLQVSTCPLRNSKWQWAFLFTETKTSASCMVYPITVHPRLISTSRNLNRNNFSANRSRKGTSSPFASLPRIPTPASNHPWAACKSSTSARVQTCGVTVLLRWLNRWIARIRRLAIRARFRVRRRPW